MAGDRGSADARRSAGHHDLSAHQPSRGTLSGGCHPVFAPLLVDSFGALPRWRRGAVSQRAEADSAFARAEVSGLDRADPDHGLLAVFVLAGELLLDLLHAAFWL